MPHSVCARASGDGASLSMNASDSEPASLASGPPGSALLDTALPAPATTVGEAGRYVIKNCLGQTSWGSVHLALDSQLSREVVVKVLKTARADSAGAHHPMPEADLLAAVRAAARLSHQNIVTVHDAGLCEQGVYIAMEHLQGRDLRSQLAEGWRPELRQAVRIAYRIGEALVHAHDAGVLHGTVEPANVFMIGRTQLKMRNFGVARAVGGLDERPSAPVDEEQARRLASYAAPERLLGEPADTRCDVYGLGLVMYELLTGRPAFTGTSPHDIRRAVLLSEAPAVHTLNPAVPVALSTVIACAMARDPALRHQSARHLLQALRSTLSDDTAGSTRQDLWRDRRLQGAAALASLVAAGGLGFVALRGASTPPPPIMVLSEPPAARGAAIGTPPSAPAAAAASAAEPVAQAASEAASEPARTVRASTPANAARSGKAALAAAPASAKRAAPRAPASAAAQKTVKVLPPVAQAREPALKSPPPGADNQNSPVAAAPALTPSTPPAAPSAAPTPTPVATPAPAPTPTPIATPGRGAIELTIEPWGQIEVNGMPVGTAPPMRRLTLPTGNYTITIRNEAFPPYSVGVNVSGDKPIKIDHRFGS